MSRLNQYKNLAVASLIRMLAVFSLKTARRAGMIIGFFLLYFPNKQRRNALINIRRCYPWMSRSAALAFRRQALYEYGKTFAEIPFLWARPAAEVLSRVKESSGIELLTRNDGRGTIVLSPHLGAWEMAGLYLSSLGPTTIIFKPQPLGDDFIRQARARAGARLAPNNLQGIRLLLDALKRGEFVGILPDQEPRQRQGAVFAPFFGNPALTMSLVNRLARKTGARVVFLFARRLPGAAGYALHCKAAPAGIDAADDLQAASALNRGVEQCVAHSPEQYLWAYKRFRSRADDSPRIYRGPR